MIEKESFDDFFTATTVDLQLTFGYRVQLMFSVFIGFPFIRPLGLDACDTPGCS